MPVINDSGTVAFRADLDAGGNGIYTSNGGAATTIANTSGTYASFGNGFSINSGGTVAFHAQLAAGGDAIFAGNGGAVSTIAARSSQFSNFGDLTAINTAGTVAFGAGLWAGGNGVFTSNDDGVPTTVADTSGDLNYISGSFDINDSGVVAFTANLDAGPKAILTGPDPVANKVVQTGDTLFGATITELFLNGGLNSDGDIAFTYTLSSGVRGVAIATIPEPTTLAFLSLGTALLFHRRLLKNPKRVSPGG
jgi:hypothetical protein